MAVDFTLDKFHPKLSPVRSSYFWLADCKEREKGPGSFLADFDQSQNMFNCNELPIFSNLQMPPAIGAL